MLRRLHLLIGLLFALAFPATGQYMQQTFPEAWQGSEKMRMMFRSAHVYILLTAIINLMYGLNLVRASGWRKHCQWLISLLLLAAPPLMLTAFFVEPAPNADKRHWVLAGLTCCIAGSLLALVSHPWKQSSGVNDQDTC